MEYEGKGGRFEKFNVTKRKQADKIRLWSIFTRAMLVKYCLRESIILRPLLMTSERYRMVLCALLVTQRAKNLKGMPPSTSQLDSNASRTPEGVVAQQLHREPKKDRPQRARSDVTME